MAAAVLAGATPSWSATRCCRSRPGWRATPTTRPRACSAGSSSPGRQREADRFDAVRLDAHPGIVPVALVAGVESSTATTRGLLPERVPLADAAFTGSRTALAVLAFTRRPDLLLPATADRLHQEYRRPAYPESAALVDALRARGVPAVISGAGPTVLALTTDGTLPSGVDPHGFTVLPLPIDPDGAVVVAA